MLLRPLGRVHTLFVFLILMIFPSLQQLSAQPANDSCAMAKIITMPLSFGDPITYSGHNIGATPEIPASSNANCTPGGIFSGLGADVWYTFTSDRAMCIRIEVAGLEQPEFSLRGGLSCSQTVGLACAAGVGGAVSEVVTLRANETYFLRVSGANYSDQGYFDLTFTRVGCPSDEDPCLVLDYFEATPQPSIAIVGDQTTEFYFPETTVHFCYTIDIWEDININWIHAVQIDLGDAWDQSSLTPILPQSCNGDGYWEWYEQWVSCNTGDVFGPGFAYDSFSGLACGGSGWDGDPGNNWGDGPIQCQPFEFCWSVTVKTCEEIEQQQQTDLDISITVLADSESGSYDLQACGQDVDEELELRTFACGDAEIETCFSQDPFIEVEPVSCFGEMDGSFTVDNVETEALSNVLIYNLNDQSIEGYIGVELPFTTPSFLDTGYYGVILETPGIGEEGFCEGTLYTIIKVEAPFETFARIIGQEDCLTDSVQLAAAVWPDTLDGFTYRWSGPDDFFSTEQNPVVTQSGDYILTTIRNGCRISDTASVILQESFELSADYFEAPPCAGAELVLTANGSSAVDAFEWVLPPGSSLNTPSYDASSDSWNFGVLSETTTIQLVGIDNDSGCADTTAFLAELNEPPTFAYEAIIDDCDLASVSVTIDMSDGIVEVNWLDDGSTTNPRVFSGLPIGSETIVPVQILDDQGCSTTASVSIVGPGVAIESDAAVLCPGEMATISSSPASSYQWSTGDTSSTIVVAPAPGSTAEYSVTILDTYGCEQVTSTTVETLPEVSAAFSVEGDELTYQFQPAAQDHPDLNYWWNFGDGTFSINYAPTHAYGMPGSYPVSLITVGTCGTDTSTQLLELQQAPQASFSSNSTSGCAPFTVEFNSTSTDADEHLWTFPGGVPETSTEADPTVTYLNPGNYPVSLTVTNAVGSDLIEIDDYLTVGQGPSASFTFSTELLQVDFSGELENAESFSWNFGDGNGSTDLNPSHEYEISGNYLVSLTAENECGTLVVTDTVNVSRSIPTVAFTTLDARQGCSPLEVTFINQSENALEYEWTFPGGTPVNSVETNPTVVYTTPGVYFVQLNAINETGANALVAESYIEVLATPSGSFTYDTEELNVIFEADFQNVNTFHWDFGDGNGSTAENPSHTYGGNGTYEVLLQLENECDTIIISETITVERDLPQAIFTSESDISGCAPLSVTFINQSTNADEYRWTFTGGNPSSSQEVNPTVTYDLPGLFPVELIAINETGEDQLIISGFVEVLPLPFAQINYLAEGLSVSFEADSEAADTYFWQFGDGNSSEEQNPMHIYDEEGMYTVQLSVSNECGSVSQTLEIEVIITSTEELLELGGVWSLYPNPSSGHVHLRFQDWPSSSNHHIRILNSLGQVMERQQIRLNQYDQTISLFLELPAGIYWIELENEDGAVWPAKKLVIQ